MDMVTIKDLDGLPAGEIRELVKDEARKVSDDARLEREKIMEKLGGRMTTMEGRMGQVENRLTGVEGRLEAVETLAKRGVELGEEGVAQNTEILSKFAGLEGEVHQVREETAEGVKITTTHSRWVQTARDLKLDKMMAFVVKLFVAWAVVWLTGRVFGPDIRDAILKKIF